MLQILEDEKLPASLLYKWITRSNLYKDHVAVLGFYVIFKNRTNSFTFLYLRMNLMNAILHSSIAMFLPRQNLEPAPKYIITIL